MARGRPSRLPRAVSPGQSMLIDPGFGPVGVRTRTYNLIDMRNNVVRWDATPFFQELPERRF